MGDERTYEQVVALRRGCALMVWLPIGRTCRMSSCAEISSEIINKVKGGTALCGDISSKPPVTIEWGVKSIASAWQHQPLNQRLHSLSIVDCQLSIDGAHYDFAIKRQLRRILKETKVAKEFYEDKQY